MNGEKQQMPRSYWVLGNAKVLLRAGHPTTLPLGAAPPVRVPTDEAQRRELTFPGCRARLRSEPSSDPGATHLTLSLLPLPSLVI